MTDYELTGQATQSDIADGADESDGRWQTLLDTGLYGSAPSEIVSAGSGAAFSYYTTLAFTASPTTGDWGTLAGGGLRRSSNGAVEPANGTVLIECTYASGVAIGSLNDHHFIGVVDTMDSIDETTNDIAIFDPRQGNNTTGNVRVDSNGTDTDGSVDFGTIEDTATRLVVLIDYAGNYLTAGHTGFYVDGSPLEGDTPNADLDATPSFNRNIMATGIQYVSNGNSNDMYVNYLGVFWRL